ncbi:MAG TPA: hypothetical protein VFW31_03645 [Candidatus Angelobacter sp.]|nr:hypothetical protein [Candidatus Angelobacter sp.]
MKPSPGFVLRLSPLARVQNSMTGDGCRAQLFNAQHERVFSVADFGISIVLTGQDVNGDGNPDLVLEAYSGGAHCCWTYYIISLSREPGLLAKFENERGAGFVLNNRTGKMEIETLDGAFDYFDNFSHGGTPFPDVYLRLDDRRLIDISREHKADYDRRISELKSAISVKELAIFIQAENTEEKIGWEQVSSKVVAIVQAYLYSGRPKQAHAALTQMWPPFDQDHMWKLILETRRKGILRYTRQSGG